MILKSVILAAAVAGAAMAAPASAGQSAPQTTVQTANVHYSDLNLATPEGQAVLDQRVKAAAWKVCRQRNNSILRSAEDQDNCYQQARRDLAVQVATLIADRQRGG